MTNEQQKQPGGWRIIRMELWDTTSLPGPGYNCFNGDGGGIIEPEAGGMLKNESCF